MRVYVYSLGCRLNQCEGEAIADSFAKCGYEIVKEADKAELVIINSCTVTTKAEQKARRMIRLFSKSAEALIVTGCYVEMAESEIKELSEKIVIFNLAQKASILELPEYLTVSLSSHPTLLSALLGFKKHDASVFDFNPLSYAYHSRAYLKVQDGCDNHCGYCLTSVARGKSLFLDADEAVRRAVELERAGMHEIMLTGVNLTNYDYNGLGLGGLLKRMLAETGENMRFRLSSMEPDHVDDRLLDAISDKRVQPHFHIPIQSASERVLSIANRKYSIKHVEEIINTLRNIKDDPFIACDIIAGLPGEGEAEFKESVDFIEKVQFSAMHVFPYSPRPNTPLYSASHSEERVRDERAAILRLISERHSRAYIERQYGKIVEVLLEKGEWGTTGNYLKVKVADLSSGHKNGDLIQARITSIFPLQASALS